MNALQKEKQWFEENKKYFSYELNGYLNPPFNYYHPVLDYINQDGKVIDLGMGNGMLLKFLTLFSGRRLVPYGVEIRAIPFEQARKKILPDYSNNLFESNIRNYNFKEGPFDLVIANLAYAYPYDWNFLKKTIENTKVGGRIILQFYTENVGGDAKNINEKTDYSKIMHISYHYFDKFYLGILDM